MQQKLAHIGHGQRFKVWGVGAARANDCCLVAAEKRNPLPHENR
jgi:hypothetical protein